MRIATKRRKCNHYTATAIRAFARTLPGLTGPRLPKLSEHVAGRGVSAVWWLLLFITPLAYVDVFRNDCSSTNLSPAPFACAVLCHGMASTTKRLRLRHIAAQED